MKKIGKTNLVTCICVVCKNKYQAVRNSMICSSCRARNCEDCGGLFQLRTSNLERKYCANCYNKQPKREETKRKMSLASKGKPKSEVHAKKIREWQLANPKDKEKYSEMGKIYALKRWDGHVKKQKVKKIKIKKTNEELLARRRFNSKQYRISKKNAEGSHTFEEWEALKKTYRNMCLCCKRTEPEIKLTEDHIIPLSKGGTDYIWNIQPLCARCNTRKFTKTINYKEPLMYDYKFLEEKGGERKNIFTLN